MIAGYFHQGSGLGDQLFRYITVRTLAEEKGHEWGMIGNFKGTFFLNQPNIVSDAPFWLEKAGLVKRWNEKDVRENGIDIRSYDPEINFVKDNSVIDGSFEDDKYWGHNLENINKWLEVEPLEVPANKIVVGFRGGEYALNSDLFLPIEYYKAASFPIVEDFKGKMSYEVHTDDPILATKFFEYMPALNIIENQAVSHSQHSNMGFNWRSARFAKYAIIPNSAFFILPRLLKHLEDPTAITIAPRYWARRNTKTWARPACFYKQFQYI